MAELTPEYKLLVQKYMLGLMAVPAVVLAVATFFLGYFIDKGARLEAEKSATQRVEPEIQKIRDSMQDLRDDTTRTSASLDAIKSSLSELETLETDIKRLLKTEPAKLKKLIETILDNSEQIDLAGDLKTIRERFRSSTISHRRIEIVLTGKDKRKEGDYVVGADDIPIKLPTIAKSKPVAAWITPMFHNADSDQYPYTAFVRSFNDTDAQVAAAGKDDSSRMTFNLHVIYQVIDE